MMNSVLFLLIGLEVLSIHQSRTYLMAGMIAVCCVLVGRTVSVAIPLGVIGLRIRFPKGTTRLMIWGACAVPSRSHSRFCFPVGPSGS